MYSSSCFNLLNKSCKQLLSVPNNNYESSHNFYWLYHCPVILFLSFFFFINYLLLFNFSLFLFCIYCFSFFSYLLLFNFSLFCFIYFISFYIYFVLFLFLSSYHLSFFIVIFFLSFLSFFLCCCCCCCCCCYYLFSVKYSLWDKVWIK